jgi:hypothetical protein
VRPVIRSAYGCSIRPRRLRAQGESFAAIGTRLEEEGYRPRRGAHWHPTTVKRILERARWGYAQCPLQAAAAAGRRCL